MPDETKMVPILEEILVIGGKWYIGQVGPRLLFHHENNYQGRCLDLGSFYLFYSEEALCEDKKSPLIVAGWSLQSKQLFLPPNLSGESPYTEPHRELVIDVVSQKGYHFTIECSF